MWCGYLVAAADLFDTEPSAGPVGGAATLWLRSATFQDVAEDVLGHLRWLGLVHPYAPGIFQTGSRDLPGMPFLFLSRRCLALWARPAIIVSVGGTMVPPP